ncbi:hypothetical protein MPLA_190003 [Mesorhizobium sp. ORS 3359]|nr:hypothetical protein MPLA_190003 [Mesorhizobium sp. ORS 3359]
MLASFKRLLWLARPMILFAGSPARNLHRKGPLPDRAAPETLGQTRNMEANHDQDRS